MPPPEAWEPQHIGRPVRHGKWFVLHSSYLLTIDFEEQCDIHLELLRDHPNGGEPTADLIAVRLSDEQIKALRGRIRISSYRWEGMKENTEGVAIPANYLRFLDHIREHKLVLWMDWMANVGVNVPVPETLAYMGLLYAECVVLGDWMLNVDRLGTALTRAWIFQEMSFGPLDEEAMGGLFEQLRARGKALGDAINDGAAISAYMHCCGCVASLLTRRAFGAAAEGCGWYQAITAGQGLSELRVDGNQFRAAYRVAMEALPGVDDTTWDRLMSLCSPKAINGWDGEWKAHRPELLSLVCAAPYSSCESLDALLRRYAAGLVEAAVGCQVTFESDRAEAATAVLRAIARERFGEELSAEEVVRRAWPHVLAAKTEWGYFKDFGAGKVHAPIVAGSLSLALAPLRLHGARVTIVENTERNLTCSYTAADGSVITFDAYYTVGFAVQNAGLRGVALVDRRKGLPAEPLPKPRDAEGREADIWLCVSGAEPSATAAKEFINASGDKGLAFILLTQPRDETVAWTPSEAVPTKGERVISLRVGESSFLNLQGKPPMADLYFCEGSD